MYVPEPDPEPDPRLEPAEDPEPEQPNDKPSTHDVRAADRPNYPAHVGEPDRHAILLFMGGIVFLTAVALVAILASRASINAMHRATDRTTRDTKRAHTLTAEATSTADEIDRFIAQQLADAYERGRNALPGSRHE